MDLSHVTKEELLAALKTAAPYLPHPNDLNEKVYDNVQLPVIQAEFDLVESTLHKIGTSIEQVHLESQLPSVTVTHRLYEKQH